MIRFRADIIEDAQSVFNRQMHRERIVMRSFFVWFAAIWAVWMSSAAALAVYSREVAEFLAENF